MLVVVYLVSAKDENTLKEGRATPVPATAGNSNTLFVHQTHTTLHFSYLPYPSPFCLESLFCVLLVYYYYIQ